VGLGLLIVEVSRSHSDTPHSVGLLWTSDRPVAETSTWQHIQLSQVALLRSKFYFQLTLHLDLYASCWLILKEAEVFYAIVIVILLLVIVLRLAQFDFYN
jgi:hypothetical protein